MITNPDAIHRYRLQVLRQAIKLEIKGLKHSGGSVTARVKREFGFTGNRATVLTKLEQLIKETEV